MVTAVAHHREAELEPGASCLRSDGRRVLARLSNDSDSDSDDISDGEADSLEAALDDIEGARAEDEAMVADEDDTARAREGQQQRPKGPTYDVVLNVWDDVEWTDAILYARSYKDLSWIPVGSKGVTETYKQNDYLCAVHVNCRYGIRVKLFANLKASSSSTTMMSGRLINHTSDLSYRCQLASGWCSRLVAPRVWRRLLRSVPRPSDEESPTGRTLLTGPQ